jgi:hypothetical protein
MKRKNDIPDNAGNKDPDNTGNDITENENELLDIFENEEELTDIARALLKFYEHENFLSKTDIKSTDIKTLSKILGLSDIIQKYTEEGNDLLLNIIGYYILLRISRDRKGREEIFKTLQYSNAEEEKEPKRGLLKRFFRR